MMILVIFGVAEERRKHKYLITKKTLVHNL